MRSTSKSNFFVDFISARFKDGFRSRARICQVVGILCVLATLVPIAIGGYKRLFWTAVEGEVTGYSREITGKDSKGHDVIVWRIRYAFTGTDGRGQFATEVINYRQAYALANLHKIAVYVDPADAARNTTTAGLYSYWLAAGITLLVGFGYAVVGTIVWLLAWREGATWQRKA